MMFIGRNEELSEIRDALKSDKFESILIYGRRRVGKSELIQESLINYDKKIIKFECRKASNSINLELLTKLIADELNNPYVSFNNFDEIFDYIFKFSINNEFVFVIDEFSFLLENDFSIESSLATAIDTYKNNSKLKLIISGSYVTLITKMLEYNSHCYGRFNHILLIRPFNYFEISKFYENYSDEDKIKIYSCFGGIPYFNSLIDPSKSADDNIINLLIKKDSIIEHEINEMILMETNKIGLLNDLIYIIGKGVHKYKDIISITKQNNFSRPDYLLNKLIEMDIIEKVTPINDKKNSKRMFFRFKDNLIHFYYKYLFNNPYSINRSNPSFFYQNFIKNDFETFYIPKKFERISMEFLLRKNFNNYFDNLIYDIGCYSYDDPKNKINREFDVVTLDELGYISYECKYTNKPLDNDAIYEEEAQTKDLKNIDFYRLGFISKSGFTDSVDKDKYICFMLSDFYKE